MARLTGSGISCSQGSAAPRAVADQGVGIGDEGEVAAAPPAWGLAERSAALSDLSRRSRPGSEAARRRYRPGGQRRAPIRVGPGLPGAARGSCPRAGRLPARGPARGRCRPGAWVSWSGRIVGCTSERTPARGAASPQDSRALWSGSTRSGRPRRSRRRGMRRRPRCPPWPGPPRSPARRAASRPGSSRRRAEPRPGPPSWPRRAGPGRDSCSRIPRPPIAAVRAWSCPPHPAVHSGAAPRPPRSFPPWWWQKRPEAGPPGTWRADRASTSSSKVLRSIPACAAAFPRSTLPSTFSTAPASPGIAHPSSGYARRPPLRQGERQGPSLPGAAGIH